jgi:hypothetical protein
MFIEDYFRQLITKQIDNLIDQRQRMTTTFLSINTALLAILAVLLGSDRSNDWTSLVSVSLILFAGAVVCDLWRRLIVRYQKLLAWWYEKLRLAESELPEEVRFFTMEYNELYKHPRTMADNGLSKHQVTLTRLFEVLYLVFALATAFLLAQTWGVL